MKWIIETNIFQDEHNFLSAIKNCGQEVILYNPSWNEKIFQKCLKCRNKYDYYAFKGSFQGLKQVQQYFPNLIHSNPNDYNCNKYYPFLKDYLYNRNFEWVMKANLKNYLGYFVRSNSSQKLFTGQILDDLNKVNHLDNETMMIVAKGEDLTGTKEFRFVANKQKIITGSIYLDHSINNDITINKELYDYAEEVRKDYIPDDLWTIDLIKNKEGINLVEINSFSFADLYECDIEEVFKEMNYFSKNSLTR